MNTELILNYLTDLEQNNCRDWYHGHKEEYKAANAEFEALIQELILRIGVTDSSILHNEPKDLTFRLTRDTRFSHDKSPYIPAFRAHIAPMGKLPVPVGYYLMIKPGGRSFLGGGLFADMFKDATSMIRNHIAKHPDRWETVITAPGFTKNFTVSGTSLKNVPAGYDKTHPQAQYLKYKSWYLEYPISDELLCSPEDFLALAADVFTQMQPFNRFLNTALDGFKMPERP